MSVSQKYGSGQSKKSYVGQSEKQIRLKYGIICRSVRNIDQIKVRNHMSVSQKYRSGQSKKSYVGQSEIQFRFNKKKIHKSNNTYLQLKTKESH